jgi:Core-2/I-Branching enzyme
MTMARCISPRRYHPGYHQEALQLLLGCCLLLLASQLWHLRLLHRHQVNESIHLAIVKSVVVNDSVHATDDDSNPIASTPTLQQDPQTVPLAARSPPYSITVERGRRSKAIPIANITLRTVGDIVELDHCYLETVNWSNFSRWADPIINTAFTDFLRQVQHLQKSENKTVDAKVATNLRSHNAMLKYNTSTTLAIIRDEWMLQLLEMHATQYGLCDFAKYRPTIPQTSTTARTRLEAAGERLRHIVQTVPKNQETARIAFCIIAYRDVTHLTRLVQAIHMPQHLIVIHLEDSTSVEYSRQVQERVAKRYNNVVIVQFGTIIYRTDSISMINLRLMQWMVNELELDYDFHVTLGGAVFPLYNALSLAQYLYQANHRVWLGELLHNGMRIHHPQAGLLYNKRVILPPSTLEAVVESFIPTSNGKYVDILPTTSDFLVIDKFQRRVGFLHGYQNPVSEKESDQINDTAVVPSWIHSAMQHKSVSGNQAVFATPTVRLLLENSHVLQLFAMAKYGCCCCIEERLWIAALHLVGLGDDAKTHTSMFQVWGGDTGRCRGSMNNAVLTQDDTSCFRSEYPRQSAAKSERQHNAFYFMGNETLHHLLQAKKEGFMFARKFDSDREESMTVLNDVIALMHV